ncbi:hypothetical protein ACW9HQ_52445, partial [Nocardia gipuzkoensis]
GADLAAARIALADFALVFGIADVLSSTCRTVPQCGKLVLPARFAGCLPSSARWRRTPAQTIG